MALKVTLTNSTPHRYTGRKAVLDGVERALKSNKLRHGRVDIILVTDADIKKMHKRWFNDGTVTDVITFPIEEQQPILAEIYISLDRARYQAGIYKVSVRNELCRLAIHGALHLAGFTDATAEEKHRMHELENRYI
jgi:rRNA maturation RNase YbeY